MVLGRLRVLFGKEAMSRDAFKDITKSKPSIVHMNLDCCFQLLGELLDPEEASLLQDASYVDAFVDDELAVSQVVEDGLEVFGAAVDQVRAMLVPLVTPNICRERSEVSEHRSTKTTAQSDRLTTHLSLETCERACSPALCSPTCS